LNFGHQSDLFKVSGSSIGSGYIMWYIKNKITHGAITINLSFPWLQKLCSWRM